MMNAHYRLKHSTTLLLLAFLGIFLLGGCAAGRRSFSRGQQAELTRDFETAMNEYRAALDENPGNIEYRLKYEQARFAAAFAHFDVGRRALNANDLETARREFTRALEIDITHELARTELAKVEAAIAAPAAGQPVPPLQFEELREQTRVVPTLEAQLDIAQQGPITQIRMVQPSRTAYETLAEMAGLNVIFDLDFRPTPVTLELDNVDVFEALEILSLQTRNFWQPINRNTILVSPDNQTKRREYEQHVLKTIYLSNSVTSTEVTEAITALRTLLNMRYVVPSTSVNAIIIRDTADRIAIAEKILEDIDKSKPEVIVEATVLEVDRNYLRELGILPPTGTVMAFAPGGADTAGDAGSNVISLRDLDGINSGSFAITIPDTVAKFLASSGRTKLLQNPSVRATDGKLASIHIGSRVPVPSGSFQPAFVGATGTPVVQFQYVDVGVNLDITPKVLLNREIAMTVLVQVSALAGDRNVGGITLPVFTNRQVTQEIRLAEGESNILGGIIQDTESTSITGIPGLKDIPILKYLFGQETSRRDETEIVVLLTPRIIRMPNIQELNLRGLNIGTDANTRLRPTPGFPMTGFEEPTPAPPLVPGIVPGTPITPAPPLNPNGAANQPQAPLPVSNAALTFVPSPVEVAASGVTPVNIVVDGTNIFGADLMLQFNPQAVTIRQINEGGFLSRDGQIVAVVQNIDSESGMARISLERPPGVAAINGNGSLITLILEAGMMKGDTTIRVTDFQVRDPRNQASTARPAEVRVTVR